jgi:hypothetical protein
MVRTWCALGVHYSVLLRLVLRVHYGVHFGVHYSVQCSLMPGVRYGVHCCVHFSVQDGLILLVHYCVRVGVHCRVQPDPVPELPRCTQTLTMAKLEAGRELSIISAPERETKHNITWCVIHKNTADGVYCMACLQVQQNNKGVTNMATMKGVQLQRVSHA